MDVKEISAQQYNSLDRKTKRELKRSLKKQGLEQPDIIERVQLVTTIDKEIYLKGLKVLEANGIVIDNFIDLAFINLIKVHNTK